MKVRRFSCDEDLDLNYQKLFEVGEDSLFKTSLYYSEMKNSLIGYSISDQYIYSYSYKNQVYFSEKCIQQGYLELLLNFTKRVEPVRAFMILNFLTCLAFVSIVGYTLYQEKKTVDEILYDTEQIRAYFVFTSRILNTRIYSATFFGWIFSLVMMIVSLVFIQAPYYVDAYECADDFTNK